MNTSRNKEIYLEMLSKLLERQEETNKQIGVMDKKLDLHIQKTELELGLIHKQDERQNDLLEAHHKRSDEISRDNELRELSIRQDLDASVDEIKTNYGPRIESLERPRKWFFVTGNIIVRGAKVLAAMTAGSAAVYGLYQFLQGIF